MFASPAGLLALGSLPVVVLLHYLRRRTRKVEVPSLLLWERLLEREELPPARAFEADLSLFLQLGACLAIAVALSGPQVRMKARAQVAVVIDNSTAMETRSRGGATRLEEAAREARLLRADVFVATAPHPHRVDRPEEISVVHLPGDVAGAVSLADKLAGDVRVIGDSVPEGLSGKRVGGESRNCAIVACEFGEDGAFAAVKSFSRTEEEREVVLAADGRELARGSILLARGERKDLVLRGELSGAELVELSLVPADDLPVDDVVRGAAGPGSGTAVFLGPREEAVERAVRACGWGIARAERAEDVPEGGVAFCVSCAPELPQATLAVYFAAGPPGRVEPSGEGRELRDVRGLELEDVPLLRGIDGGSVFVRSALRTSPVGPAEVLARVQGNPLIWRWSEGGRERLYFAFLPSGSDWPGKASWPVFVARLLEATGPGGWKWLRPGEPAPSDIEGTPRGQALLRCGLYETAAGKVAVNLLDEGQSDNRLGPEGASAGPSRGAYRERELSWVFAAAALGLFLADWFARRE